MDDLAILVLVLKLFISLAPPQVVAEHRQKIWHPDQAAQMARLPQKARRSRVNTGSWNNPA